MKKLLIAFYAFLLPSICQSQWCLDTVAYDNMETYDWLGNWWIPAATTGFFNNASVSPSLSAVIYGSGSGTSASEQDWYSLPNIAGLNPLDTHVVSFRLASYRFSNTTATTRGVDNADIVEVQLSTDGGIAYVAEMRIRGNANAFWNYNTLGVASKVRSGAVTIYTPAAGGDRTATGDGFSVIRLVIPPGPTQIAVDIFCRVNSAGEEWWIDNVLLENISDCSILPITLASFEAKCENGATRLQWKTITELNNDHFTLEKSNNGYDWFVLGEVPGAGTTTQATSYEFVDLFPGHGGNYYRLTQTDYSGDSETFNIIYTDCNDDLPSNVSIYPSPANDEFKITIDVDQPEDRVVKYEVYSTFGLLLEVGYIDLSLTKTQVVDTKTWPSGVYTVIVGQDTPFVKKIIINR